jgi:hypothetical protein
MLGLLHTAKLPAPAAHVQTLYTRGASHDGICPHIWSINLGLEVKQSTVGVVSLIMLPPFLLPPMSLYGLQRFFTRWQCL